MNSNVSFNMSATQLLGSFLTWLGEHDNIDPNQAIQVDPARLALLLEGARSAPKPTVVGTSVTVQAVSSFDPDNDPYSQYIGQNMFLRGGIFAFLGHILSNHRDYLVCDQVLWFADTGEYQQLMQLGRGKHIDTLSSCKPQWYQPGRKVIIAKKLLSDISVFEGDFLPTKGKKLKPAQEQEWDLDPYSNPIKNLIGEQVFLRNGIFAYSGTLQAVSNEGITLNNVVWYADTGDYQELLNTGSNTHISSLSGCKPQWYKPELSVFFNSELFSDIFGFEANTTYKP